MSKALKGYAATFAFLGLVGFAVSALFKKPKVVTGNGTNDRQPRPVVRRAVGVGRVSGAFAKRQDYKNFFAQVIGYPEGPGPVDHYGRAWINEDEVKPLGDRFQQLDDGRYETGRAKYWEKFGLQDQTAYSQLLVAPWNWSAQHYGTGVPSNLFLCEHGKKEDAGKQFPAGVGTDLTREAFYKAYDWRKDDTAGGVGNQRRIPAGATRAEIDAITAEWDVTSNPIVNMVNVEMQLYGADWGECFANALDILTESADVCDELILQRNNASQVSATTTTSNQIPLVSIAGLDIGSDLNVAGRTYEVTNIVGNVVYVTPAIEEKIPIFTPARWINATPVYKPRYEIFLQWDADEPRKEVRKKFLTAMDGHFAGRVDGSYIIRSGFYYAPTVIFGSDEILEWEYSPGPPIGEAANVLTLSFTDPVNGYKDTDSDDWRDDDDILVAGREVVDDFSPEGILNDSTLKRLAKIKMGRDHSGTVTIKTPLSARRGLSERFIGLRIRGCPDLNSAVMEVLEAPTVSLLGTPSITWTGKLVTPNRYSWNAELEEGVGPIAGYYASSEPLLAPDIVSLEAFTEPSGESDGVRVRIEVLGPERGDLSWFYRYRVAGETSWAVLEGDDLDPGYAGTFDSIFLTAERLIEIAVAYETGGGTLSPWSEISTVYTAIAPGTLDFRFPSNSGLLVIPGMV